MKRSALIRIGFILALALCAPKIHGQSEPEPANDPIAPAADAQNSTDSSSTAQAVLDLSTEQQQYVPALDGAGLFSLQKIQGFRILAGGAVSTGFDTNPNNSADSMASGLYSFLPYIGMAAGNVSTQLLLQYRPVFTRYTAYAGNSMQQVSARFTNRSRPRWSWAIGMDGMHGNDAVRPLAPSNTIVIGNVAGSGSSAASYLPNAGTVTDINGGFDLLYDLSPRDALAVRIANSYNSYPQLHQNSGVVTETVNYTHLVRPTLEFLVYEQTSQYYLDIHCTTVGGGFGVTWEPRSHIELSLQGGPQLNSSGCQADQGFSYHAYLSSNIRGQSQFYVRGDRQPVNGFLGPGLWQNDVSGGYQRKFAIHNLVSADLGYTQSSTLANTGDYKGFYADASYVRQLKGPFSLSCKYQSFVGRQGTPSFTRNLLLFSILFTPASPLLSE